MRTLVPFSADAPKTRLSSLLSAAERIDFSRTLCSSVVETLHTAGFEPTILSAAPIADEWLSSAATVVVDSQPLTAAVNTQLAAGSPTLILMADVPLATPGDIHRLVDSPADVTIAPGLGGGTNALVVREPAFRVDYHGASYLDHCRIADRLGASVDTVDSRRLATDIDEPSDLAELFIHGEGAARDWLVDAGFELDDSGGRVGVRRIG